MSTVKDDPTAEAVLNVTYTSFDPTPTSVEFFIGDFGPGAAGDYFDSVSSERTYSQFIGDGLFRVNDAFTFDVIAYAGDGMFWAVLLQDRRPEHARRRLDRCAVGDPRPGAVALLGLAGLAGRRRRD